MLQNALWRNVNFTVERHCWNSSVFYIRYVCLTFVNPSRVKSTTLPAVIVSRFWHLTIMKNKMRLSLDGMSYQSESYTASPIDLLWRKRERLRELDTVCVNSTPKFYYQKQSKQYYFCFLQRDISWFQCYF